MTTQFTDAPVTMPAAPDTTVCTVCELPIGPFDPAEADYLVGVHNELHHGGPTDPPQV